MFGVAVIAIIVIVIAGGTISSEVSTGSIKFWALTPNKRWKILTAKILSVLFYIIVITLLIVAITIVISNVFFGDAETGDQYIYVKNGEIRQVKFFRYYNQILHTEKVNVRAGILAVVVYETIIKPKKKVEYSFLYTG